MIAGIAGWSSAVHGRTVVQLPPEGPALGGIRYLERNRPLRRAVDVVRDLPIPPDARLRDVTAPRALVTDEGEYAALLSADAVWQDRLIRRFVGIVYVDDYYSLTIGQCRRPEAYADFAALVETLVRGDRHHQPLRRRRYLYDAPGGWHGYLVDGYLARWLPLDHPRHAAELDVYPALPRVGPGDAHDKLEAVLGERAITSRGARRAVAARGNLTGEAWSVTTARGAHHFALLADDRFLYPLILTTAADGSPGVLDEVIATIEPIPRARRAEQDFRAATMAVWAD